MPDPIQPTAATATATAPVATPAAAPPAATGVTVDDIMKVCPDADKNNVAQLFPLLAREMAKAGLTSKNQIVAIAATIYTEMRSWSCGPEVGKGKGKYGPYYGRGPLQLTHKGNYERAGKDLGLDLVNNPDLAMQPENAARIFIWYWKGGSGGPSIVPYAEKGDWRNCRSIVNAGRPNAPKINGLDVFTPTIQRGIQHFKSGIDPNATATSLMPGDYGLGCLDTGGASGRTITAANPMTQQDALSYALGIHALDSYTHIFEALVDLHAQPDALKLDAQLTFEAKEMGVDLDGTYTVEEVTFYFSNSLECEVIAKKPDPNASAPEVFMHDANAPATAGQPQPGVAAQPVAAGDIGRKIYEAAISTKGKSSASGPGGGNTACAWCVNRVVLAAAGISMIGSNPDLVDSVEAALKAGRGQLIEPRTNAQPGDIVVMGRGSAAHIGVYTGNGKAATNSSRRALCGAWETTFEDFDRNYPVPCRVYRVVS